MTLDTVRIQLLLVGAFLPAAAARPKPPTERAKPSVPAINKS